jgi:hypothetical protein
VDSGLLGLNREPLFTPCQRALDRPDQMSTHPASGGSSSATAGAKNIAVLNDGSMNFRRVGLERKPLSPSSHQAPAFQERGTAHRVLTNSSPVNAGAKGIVIPNDGLIETRHLGLQREPSNPPSYRTQARCDQTAARCAMSDCSPVTDRGKGIVVLNDGSVKTRRLGLQREPSNPPSHRAQARCNQTAACRAMSDCSSVTTMGKDQTNLNDGSVELRRLGLNREPLVPPSNRASACLGQGTIDQLLGDSSPDAAEVKNAAVLSNGLMDLRRQGLIPKPLVTPFDRGPTCSNRTVTRLTTGDSSRISSETKSQAVPNDGWIVVRRRRLKREPSPSVIDRGPNRSKRMVTCAMTGDSAPASLLAQNGTVLRDGLLESHRPGLRREPLIVSFERVPTYSKRTTACPEPGNYSPTKSVSVTTTKNGTVLHDGLVKPRRPGLKREPSAPYLERVPTRLMRMANRSMSSSSSTAIIVAKDKSVLVDSSAESGYLGLAHEPSVTHFERVLARSKPTTNHPTMDDSACTTAVAKDQAVLSDGRPGWRHREPDRQFSFAAFGQLVRRFARTRAIEEASRCCLLRPHPW